MSFANTPERNQRLLGEHAKMATWQNVEPVFSAARLALRMKAALEMVLLFHAGEPWDSAKGLEWFNRQVEAGREFPQDEATTKALCSTIREVLGLAKEDS